MADVEPMPSKRPASLDLFQRLAALNSRLAAQTERLEAIPQTTPSRRPTIEVIARLALLKEEYDPDNCNSVSSADCKPLVGSCSEQREAIPQKPTRPATAPPSSAPVCAKPFVMSTATSFRVLESWLSSDDTATSEEGPAYRSSEVAESPEYRSWTHNTNYFRDGSRLWVEYIADIALFNIARESALRGEDSVRVWSCGCSSGEELFSVRMAYEHWVHPTLAQADGPPPPKFVGVGTDRSSTILEAAQDSRVEWSEQALGLVPREILDRFFEEQPEPHREREQRLRDAMMNGGFTEKPKRRFTLHTSVRSGCAFRVQDTSEVADAPSSLSAPLSASLPASLSKIPHDQQYDLILCRYSIFLYATDEQAAKRALARITSRLRPNGILLLGATDALPQCASQLLEPVPLDELTRATDACREERRPATAVSYHSHHASRNALVNAWRLKQPRRAGPGLRSTSAESNRHTHADTPATAHLRDALSLQHYRRLLGLKAAFFEAPRNAAKCWIGEKSAAILKAKGGIFEAPLISRAAEYERQRQQKLTALRAEREEAEMAELRGGRQAMALHKTSDGRPESAHAMLGSTGQLLSRRLGTPASAATAPRLTGHPLDHMAAGLAASPYRNKPASVKRSRGRTGAAKTGARLTQLDHFPSNRVRGKILERRWAR